MSDKNTEGNKSEDKLSDDKKIPELNAELKKNQKRRWHSYNSSYRK
jgi:hypothetical protein